MLPLSRRRFLQLASLAGLGTVLAPSELLARYRFLDPVSVENGLAHSPDWTFLVSAR